jgi:hypothetical protein
MYSKAFVEARAVILDLRSEEAGRMIGMGRFRRNLAIRARILAWR